MYIIYEIYIYKSIYMVSIYLKKYINIKGF